VTYIADTSAIVALLSKADHAHDAVLELYRETGKRWVLPWCILPEVDYLAGSRLGRVSQAAFVKDLADGAWRVEWGEDRDLQRARELDHEYRDLRLGLVDSTVMALAERLAAAAIVTLDLRHFGAVRLAGGPRIVPRDGGPGEVSERNRRPRRS
jgi:predicted nucleic acid-binding protein